MNTKMNTKRKRRRRKKGKKRNGTKKSGERNEVRGVRYVTWHWQKDATTWEGKGEKSRTRGKIKRRKKGTVVGERWKRGKERGAEYTAR